MKRSSVTLYSFSFCHHGRYSSFHRLLRYSTGYRCLDASLPLARWLPLVWRRRLEYHWRLWSEWRLRPILARAGKQCVHYLYPENSLFRGGKWKGAHGLVLSCHQPDFGKMTMIQEDAPFVRALKTADRVVLLSANFAQRYEEFCSPGAIRIIPHGVDVDFFHPSPSGEQAPLVLTIGNWLRDYDFWAELAFRLVQRLPKVRFAVVAMPEVVENVRDRARERLGTRVQFLYGLTDPQLRKLYHQAALLFLPLKDAGANNALLEAMACGLPSLVSDLPATREYGGEALWYFARGNNEECLTKIVELLNRPQLRGDLGFAARRRAVDRLAWNIIAARYAELYAEVLKEVRPPIGLPTAA